MKKDCAPKHLGVTITVATLQYLGCSPPDMLQGTFLPKSKNDVCHQTYITHGHT